MLNNIPNFINNFLEKTQNKDIHIISHNDTDGITSIAIFIRTLERLDKTFSIKIVKQLEREIIEKLPKNKILIFLDLGSNNIKDLEKLDNEIFIIDHHEIIEKVPEKIHMINPHLYKGYSGEEISASGLTYLIAKKINKKNKDLANLAVLGLIGDMMGGSLSKLNKEILEDAKTKIKKGLLLYPATRPLNKALEYSSGIYIPGVTGSYRGAIALLRETGIERINNQYKSLLELNDDEMSKLITAILLRIKDTTGKEELIGNLYLIKLFNKLHDARELSAMINACSNLGYSNMAIAFCLENKKAQIEADKIYVKHKQYLVQALNLIPKIKKEEGQAYVIINAQDQIKDTIIGTIASILSRSKDYKEGKIIVTMAYSKEKIKVSARIAGRSGNGRNVREVLNTVIESIGGEVGGHAFAAGCLIYKEKEKEFIDILKKNLEIELVKV